MDRVGRPRGLIAFYTDRHLRAVEAKTPYRYRLLRPRVLLYSALVVFIALVMGVSLFFSSTAEVHVLRERSPLFVALSDGSIRNDFTVKILNNARDPLDFAL